MPLPSGIVEADTATVADDGKAIILAPYLSPLPMNGPAKPQVVKAELERDIQHRKWRKNAWRKSGR
jgi:hypothetical protein